MPNAVDAAAAHVAQCQQAYRAARQALRNAEAALRTAKLRHATHPLLGQPVQRQVTQRIGYGAYATTRTTRNQTQRGVVVVYEYARHHRAHAMDGMVPATGDIVVLSSGGGRVYPISDSWQPSNPKEDDSL